MTLKELKSLEVEQPLLIEMLMEALTIPHGLDTFKIEGDVGFNTELIVINHPDNGFPLSEAQCLGLLSNNITNEFEKLPKNKSREFLFHYLKKINYYESYHCGCEHDCCGCISSISTTASYSKELNRLFIERTVHYNY